MRARFRPTLLALALGATPCAADVLFDGTPQLIDTQADFCFSVFAVDLDQDGDVDALSAAGLDDRIAWYENLDGAGSYGPAQVLSSSALDATSVWAADLDGDGDSDVLCTSSGDDTVAWFENLGGGNFAAEIAITTSADGAFSVQAHDLDGDGDLDVIAGSFEDDTIAWYENDGAAQFGPAQVVTSAADFFQTLSVADLDGDQDLDVLSASPFDDKIAWYANDGSGQFGPQIVLTAAIDSAQSVYAADLDGDADQDVLVGWFNAGLGWFENTDGAGTFAFAGLISSQPQGLEMVIGADLDGDGDVDALSCSALDDSVAWYENTDGAGSFGPLQLISTQADFAQTIVVADADQDGDLDVYVASIEDDEVAWYENQHCSLSVVASETVRAGTPPNPIALLPGQSSAPLLCAVWDPVIDHSSFHPGALLDFLAIAPAPTNIPLAPFGTVLCDAFSSTPLLFSGPAGTPFALLIPAQCGLLGASFCAQGMSTDGASLLLTNALDVVVGNS